MGVIREIFHATTLYRRRGLKGQTRRKGDMLFAAWTIAVILIRMLTNSGLAVRELSAGGDRAAGAAIAGFTVLHALAAAFIVTFLFSSINFAAMSLKGKRLDASPVPS